MDKEEEDNIITGIENITMENTINNIRKFYTNMAKLDGILPALKGNRTLSIIVITNVKNIAIAGVVTKISDEEGQILVESLQKLGFTQIKSIRACHKIAKLLCVVCEKIRIKK